MDTRATTLRGMHSTTDQNLLIEERSERESTRSVNAKRLSHKAPGEQFNALLIALNSHEPLSGSRSALRWRAVRVHELLRKCFELLTFFCAEFCHQCVRQGAALQCGFPAGNFVTEIRAAPWHLAALVNLHTALRRPHDPNQAALVRGLAADNTGALRLSPWRFRLILRTQRLRRFRQA